MMGVKETFESGPKKPENVSVQLASPVFKQTARFLAKQFLPTQSSVKPRTITDMLSNCVRSFELKLPLSE
jgi:hypothetical protein